MLPDDGGGGASGDPAAIRVVSGDGQSGQVNELSAPVVVEVTDAEGTPVEGATVTFALTSATAATEIFPPSATTDDRGRAEARVFLGSEGLLTGEASVMVESSASPRTSFSMTATIDNPANRAPRSDFAWRCDDLVCHFTDTSTDEDGDIAGRTWLFGDGGTSEESNPSHSYSEAGSYTVTLTVTDEDGGSDESSDQVNVTVPAPEPNKEPDAEFEVHCRDRTCFFEDKSKDDDGVITSWQWSFGDGTSSSDRSPVHTYDEDGKYQVVLTVTDDRGATDSKDHRADADD